MSRQRNLRRNLLNPRQTNLPKTKMNLFKGYWTYGTAILSALGAYYAWMMGWIDGEKFLLILAGASTVFGFRRAIGK